MQRVSEQNALNLATGAGELDSQASPFSQVASQQQQQNQNQMASQSLLFVRTIHGKQGFAGLYAMRNESNDTRSDVHAREEVHAPLATTTTMTTTATATATASF